MRGRSGISEGYARQIRNAGEVAGKVVVNHEVYGKTKHRSEVHAANPVLWPLLVKKMLDAKWTVQDAKHWVEQVKRFGECLG
jgi:hypothetical protein